MQNAGTGPFAFCVSNDHSVFRALAMPYDLVCLHAPLIIWWAYVCKCACVKFYNGSVWTSWHIESCQSHFWAVQYSAPDFLRRFRDCFPSGFLSEMSSPLSSWGCGWRCRILTLSLLTLCRRAGQCSLVLLDSVFAPFLFSSFICPKWTLPSQFFLYLLTSHFWNTLLALFWAWLVQFFVWDQKDLEYFYSVGKPFLKELLDNTEVAGGAAELPEALWNVQCDRLCQVIARKSGAATQTVNRQTGLRSSNTGWTAALHGALSHLQLLPREDFKE